MELPLRYFWMVCVVATYVNGRLWWNRAQKRMESQPDLESGYRRLYRGYMFWGNAPWIVMGLGILAGWVPSMLDFLHPSEGNTFVVAWWGLMAAILILGTYWMLWGGGAEMLERHPGVYMVPHWPASKLRVFWLATVAWNVAIGTLLLFDVHERLLQQGPAQFQLKCLWAFFPVFFAAMWLFVSYLLAASGGWSQLALHYPSTSPFSGKLFHFRSGRLSGSVNYGSCLTLGAGQDGLYLAVFPLFRFGHPPLLIPWSDVTAHAARSWLFSVVDLEFAKAPGISIRLSRGLAESLFAASETPVLVPPNA